LHRAQIEGNRRDSRRVSGSFGHKTLRCTGRPNQDAPVSISVLHPGQDCPSEFGFHAGQVRTGSGKRLLDLVEKDDPSGRLFAIDDRCEKALDLCFTLHLMSVNVSDRF
jgi:hypothetical protein